MSSENFDLIKSIKDSVENLKKSLENNSELSPEIEAAYFNYFAQAKDNKELKSLFEKSKNEARNQIEIESKRIAFIEKQIEIISSNFEESLSDSTFDFRKASSYLLITPSFEDTRYGDQQKFSLSLDWDFTMYKLYGKILPGSIFDDLQKFLKEKRNHLASYNAWNISARQSIEAIQENRDKLPSIISKADAFSEEIKKIERKRSIFKNLLIISSATSSLNDSFEFQTALIDLEDDLKEEFEDIAETLEKLSKDEDEAQSLIFNLERNIRAAHNTHRVFKYINSDSL